MSVFIDIIILLIFSICIFLGYKKGLAELILRLCSFVLALVVSLILFKPISNFVINNTQFDDNIKEYIIEISGNNSDFKIEEKDDSLKNTPEIIINYINTSIDRATKEAREDAIIYVADSVSKNIVSIVVFIILFIILRIALIFIKIISDAITELPIIKQFNKSGGILYGLLEALLITYILFTVITLFIKNPSLEQSINNSYLGSIFYNNNLILSLLFKN